MTVMDLERTEEEWLHWRRGGFGASEAAAIVGLSKYESPWSLWAKKVGLVPDKPSTERQRIGKLLEPAIGTLFEERTGLHVVGEQTWCTHPDVPWARCTADGFVVESPNSEIADALGVHEIKTDNRPAWPEVPVQIRAQVVWQMAVTRTDRAWVSVLHGGFGFEVYEMEWDASAEADWRLMHAAALDLWDHVESGVPPSVDGSEATYRALLHVYPDHEPGVMVSLDHIADLLAEREALSAQARDMNKRLDTIRNEVIETFGTAEVGTLEGVPVLSCRWSDRAGYTVAPTRLRTLRAATKKDREAA